VGCGAVGILAISAVLLSMRAKPGDMTGEVGKTPAAASPAASGAASTSAAPGVEEITQFYASINRAWAKRDLSSLPDQLSDDGAAMMVDTGEGPRVTA
jgi:hypothetical protein